MTASTFVPIICLQAKIPGDVPPQPVYFFELLVYPRGTLYVLFANFSPFRLAKGILLVILVWAWVCILAILVKEMSNFGNSCKENQIF